MTQPITISDEARNAGREFNCCHGVPNYLAEILVQEAINQARAADAKRIQELELELDKAATPIAQLLVIRNQLETQNAELREAMEDLILFLQNMEANGRPHGGRNTAYPDGCECDCCQSWDGIAAVITDAQRELDKTK